MGKKVLEAERDQMCEAVRKSLLEYLSEAATTGDFATVTKLLKNKEVHTAVYYIALQESNLVFMKRAHTWCAPT